MLVPLMNKARWPQPSFGSLQEVDPGETSTSALPALPLAWHLLSPGLQLTYRVRLPASLETGGGAKHVCVLALNPVDSSRRPGSMCFRGRSAPQCRDHSMEERGR